MKPATAVNASCAINFLDQIRHGTFQPEVFQGRRYQAVRNISDELNSIIHNLLGIIDRLQLRGLVLVNQIFIKV